MTQTTRPGFCGWDIGGAHLKIARSNPDGRLTRVIQIPCALWRGLDELKHSMAEAIRELDCEADIHAITMTGELVDAFANRQQGVVAILDCIATLLAKDKCHIFAGQVDWLTLEQAKTDWQAVASMNWQASAIYTATQLSEGLFIDIGSTTCDIVPFKDHLIQPCGSNDHERQRDGGLVYTGAIRTPLMAITNKAPLNGDFVPLAAEWFASSGDVWRLLNKLPENQIQDDTADGQTWSDAHCRQRIARMLATDAEQASHEQWQQVAMWFAEQQLHTITEACLQVMSRLPLAVDSLIIGAGVGRFMAQSCANRLNRPYIDFTNLCQNNKAAADHAPAAALALLAKQQLS